MTVSALTRPGERDRLIVKLSARLDWIFALTLCLIAGAGAVMLFSIAGSSWQRRGRRPTSSRFAMCLVMMVALAMIDLRVWFALAYPVYGLGLLLLVAVEAIGDVRLGAQRWLSHRPA
jgi:rod shape determining protein RodA